MRPKSRVITLILSLSRSHIAPKYNLSPPVIRCIFSKIFRDRNQIQAHENEGLLLRQPTGKSLTHQQERTNSPDFFTSSASLTHFQGDQRLPHDSGRPVDPSALEKLGVLYYHMPVVSSVDTLAAERGYRNRDEITVSPEKMGDIYESKVKSFFAEHLHEDEEIRYIRDGKGYFDVRGHDDNWVRIELEKDDLIILPPGIYHRFTTDETNVSFLFDFSGSKQRVCRKSILVLTRNSSSMSKLCDCSRMSPSGRL